MTNQLYVQALSDRTHVYHHAACQLVRQLHLEATVTDGVVRWNSNGAVPFMDVVLLAESIGLAVDVAACTAARDAEASTFIAEYRAARANHVPSAEERYEMRAAFGAGTEVVNIITGQKFRT